MQSGKQVTIRDLARETGVSLSTVSGVLNGVAEFSAETRRKVLEAAAARGYRPNRQARDLRAGGGPQGRQKSGIILHVTHLGFETPVGNPFESARSTLLAWEAEKLGMYPITYWYYQLKGFQCPPVINGHIDGAIVGTPHLEVLRTLKALIPTVLMDVPFSLDVADVPMVNTDWRHGFNQIFARLRELGHRRVGSLHTKPPKEGFPVETPIFEALQATARANGVEIHPECQPEVAISAATHDRVMAELAPRLAALVKAGEITAVVCPGSGYANSLRALFPDLGLRIPEDVSLAEACNGMAAAERGVCMAAHDWPGLVRTALGVLRDLIDGEASHCRELLVRPGFFPGSTIGGVK